MEVAQITVEDRADGNLRNPCEIEELFQKCEIISKL